MTAREASETGAGGACQRKKRFLASLLRRPPTSEAACQMRKVSVNGSENQAFPEAPRRAAQSLTGPWVRSGRPERVGRGIGGLLRNRPNQESR